MTDPVQANPNKEGLQVKDKIEILPVSLLNTQRPLVNNLKKIAEELGLEFGWHYLLDLTWILSHLGPLAGKRIIDAGAGTGVIQWYLASQGVQVYSVDRNSRAGLPQRFRSRYHVEGLRPEDLGEPQIAIHNQPGKTSLLRSFFSQAKNMFQKAINTQVKTYGHGKVIIYNQDLGNLADILDNSIDAVVAVSSLEHNTPDDLPRVVKELERVVKPGGVILATLGAAADQDWFHQASQGWCYSDSSLRKLFNLPADTTSNYFEYDRIISELRNCAELRDNLASFYFKSGDNGMPWGEWDPQYPPVGVCKVKPSITE